MGSDTPVWIQTVSAVAQSIIAAATLLLSYVIWVVTKRQAQAEYTRAVQDSWNTLNLAILSSPDLAPMADVLFGFPPLQHAGGKAQKRYLGFLCLNVLEEAYFGHSAGLVEKSYHLESIAHILDPLLRDPDIAALVKVGGYHSAFVRFCEERLKTLSTKVS